MQIIHRAQAFLLVPEMADARVPPPERPLGSVAMLEDPFPIEIMLAHREVQPVNAFRRHGVSFKHPAEGEVERGFIAVDVAIIKIRVVVVPPRQPQCPPAPLFIQNDLPALELRLVPVRHVTNFPNRTRRRKPSLIGQKIAHGGGENDDAVGRIGIAQD